MSDFIHNPLPMVAYAFRHPPKPCPVKGFPLAWRDMTIDDVAAYDIVVSVVDLARLNPIDMYKVSDWIVHVLAPHMSQYGKITISKFDTELSNTEGDSSFG